MTLRLRREIGGLAMRPETNTNVQDTADGGRLYSDTFDQASGMPRQAAAPNTHRTDRKTDNEPHTRVLNQKRSADTVILGALSLAVLCGLIGFAASFMWIIAIIVMVAALVFVIIDNRRNRTDLAKRQSEAKRPRQQDQPATR